MRRLIVSMIAALVAVSLVPIASAQEEDDQVTLRVGLTQDWEVLNPTSGYTVPAYEVWNLHYATLTDKAADDFATTPGLAESWEEVEPGIEYVYTLREGLTWSDDEPITAEDVAWNINTGRDQGRDNMVSTVGNIEATAEDERTVRLVSSVPDPKLPTMDVYLVPQHIWEPIATDYDAATQYAADDGVGSGPFVMTEFTPGQSVVMAANPNYWGWEGEEPPYDQVIFRLFENPDAMVAALQQGEIDAAQGFPASSWEALEGDPNIEVVAGQQGGFDEIAINGGAAEGQPHPALLDVEVRRAIAHGIDRPAVIEDLWFGLASPLETLSPSADPKWIPEIPEENQLTYDPDRANQILDDAGYTDTDGDGIREMPDGSNPLVIRHAVNTDGDLAGSIGDLMVGWMEEIGIGVELEAYDQDALFGVIVEGTYDTFFWGWVPFVDPDPPRLTKVVQRCLTGITLLAAFSTPVAAQPPGLVVSVAASMHDALAEIAGLYRAATGVTVALNTGGSNTLARQIVEGAPVGLFLSADDIQMDVVEKAGRARAGHADAAADQRAGRRGAA